MMLAALLVLAIDPPAAAAPAPDGWALFSSRCIACHASGGSAPLRLDTRASIARKSATIATVLRERFMPPWLPAGGGPFAHDAITDAQRETIAAWAAAGAAGAPDAPSEARTPEGECAFTVADGWEVPADGIHMRTFADASADAARTCVPGDASGSCIGAVRVRRSSAAIERVMLSLDRTGSLRDLDRQDPGPGAHARADSPGAPAGSLAMLGVDGVFMLPAGWCLRPTDGSAATSTASIATELHAAGRGAALPGSVRVWFERSAAGDASPRAAEAFCAGPLGAIRQQRTERSTRTDSGPLVRDVETGVIGLRTDERCTAVRVTAVAPGGAERVLLDIPRYRESLDRAYRFDPPVPLGRGTVLRIDTVHADDLAVVRSQPMAILWCAATADADRFAATATQPPRALGPDAIAGAAPSDGLTWFDAVAACNERSARDGLAPAYRIEDAERIDGHVVRARVSRLPGDGWRLPRAAALPIDPAAAADAWWWTDDERGLSGCAIVAPRDGRRDSLPPSTRIPGLWAGITRPAVAEPAK